MRAWRSRSAADQTPPPPREACRPTTPTCGQRTCTDSSRRTVLDYALRVHERHARDGELLRTHCRPLVDPILVGWVSLSAWPRNSGPDEVGVQDAMRGVTRLRDRRGHSLPRREQVEGALEAAADTRVDDTDVASEAPGATVNERDDRTAAAGRGEGMMGEVPYAIISRHSQVERLMHVSRSMMHKGGRGRGHGAKGRGAVAARTPATSAQRAEDTRGAPT